MDGKDDNGDAGEGQPTTEELVDVLQEYAVNCIVCHASKDGTIRYVVSWYDYTSADHRL